MQPGDELPELPVTPDAYATVRYAGASGDFNPIHIDDDFAKNVGLPGRIMHGLWTMAQVARALTDAGGGPHSLERLNVTFRGMALPEREITVTGKVAAVAGRHRHRRGPRGAGRQGDRPRAARQICACSGHLDSRSVLSPRQELILSQGRRRATSRPTRPWARRP